MLFKNSRRFINHFNDFYEAEICLNVNDVLNMFEVILMDEVYFSDKIEFLSYVIIS